LRLLHLSLLDPGSQIPSLFSPHERPCWLIIDYFPSMRANDHQHLGRTEHIVEEATDHPMKYSVH
jgi:hypothetical protein